MEILSVFALITITFGYMFVTIALIERSARDYDKMQKKLIIATIS